MWGPYYGMYILTAIKKQEDEEKKFNSEKKNNPKKYKDITFNKYKTNFFR